MTQKQQTKHDRLQAEIRALDYAVRKYDSRACARLVEKKRAELQALGVPATQFH